MSINAPSESALVAATNWIAGLLTGSLATSFAVLAIAGVGFGLLTGRVAVRRAVQVVVGCFVLFCAPVLVRELVATVHGSGSYNQSDLSLPNDVKKAPVLPQPTTNPFDPASGNVSRN